MKPVSSEPCVNLSIHTAPVSLTLETSRFQAYTKRNPVPPSCLVDHHLSRADSRTLYVNSALVAHLELSKYLRRLILC